MNLDLVFLLSIFGGIGGVFAVLNFLVYLFLEWPRFEVRLRENVGVFIGASIFTWLPEGRTLIVERIVSTDINMILGTLLGILIIAIAGAFIGSFVQNTVVSLFEQNAA